MQEQASKVHLAVLMTCFNRAKQTTRCLEALAGQRSDAVLTVCLVDDGSTDGTADVVREFPFVRVLSGHDLFWNKGMWTAWKAALPDNPDAFLWLNDDVELDSDAIARAIAAMDKLHNAQKPTILVGATRSEAGDVTYSGFDKDKSLMNFSLKRKKYSEEIQECDTFNGNFVLIPRSVVQKIGIIDPQYYHSFGDIDYGLRAKKAGVRNVVLPRTIGRCEANERKRTDGWGSRSLSLTRRWKIVNTHLGLHVRSWLRFCSRYAGPLWPVVFARQYVYLLGIDRLIKRR